MIPTQSTLTHDADGNLTEDGTWTYTYDGENRLQKMSKSGQTLTFTYDYAGRRIRKVVTGTGAKDVKYLWSGWQLAAELGSDGVTVTRTFVWGPDFSDGRGQAGGAGSLLAQIDGATVTYAVPDVLGNIVGYADTSGTIVAAREFTPFGRILNATSASADYPIGYSGQYTDAETELVYYGLRYYSPRLGRFVNRDPIEETGGNNLYAFVGNSPTNGWDVRGLALWCHPTGYTTNCYTRPDGVFDCTATNIPVGWTCEEIGGGGGGGGGGSGGGGDGSGGTVTPNAPKKTPCEALASRLAYAQYVESSQQRNFGENGIYAPVVSGLSGSELGVLRNPSDSGSLSSFNPFDRMNLVVGTGSAGSSVWAFNAGRALTQTSTPVGQAGWGMTAFSNTTAAARFAGGVGLGLGIASTTMSATATLTADNLGDRISNGAATILGGIGMVKGPVGVVTSIATLAVNGFILMPQQAAADRQNRINTTASARSAIAAIQTAQRTISNVSAEMRENGCL